LFENTGRPAIFWLIDRFLCMAMSVNLRRIVQLPAALLSATILCIPALQAQVKKYTTEEYVREYQEVAIEEMRLYRIPASITMGQGILESNSGNSILAVNSNNHFGIKCKAEWTGEKYYHDDDEKGECFRKYPSVRDSYRDHSLFLTTRERYAFLFALPLTDYQGWARGLKQAGYATDPNYAEKLIKAIEDNHLQSLDQGKIFDFRPPETDSAIVEVISLIPDTVPVVTNEEVADFGDVAFPGNSRRTGQVNGVRFVYALAGDSYDRIAADLGLSVRELALYNDVRKGHTPTPSEVVFIELKKERGIPEYHIAAPGETLHSISQFYGVRLKSLCRKNQLKPDDPLIPGQQLMLQKAAGGG
jgi:hypothetical protein